VTREEELLNRQSKKTLIKLYLRANHFRARDVDIWDYVARNESDEFWQGLRESDSPKGYVWNEIQRKRDKSDH